MPEPILMSCCETLMNRNELRGLPKAAVGATVLQSQLLGKRLLWLDTDAVIVPGLENYFDVIVATNETQLHDVKPDLFVYDTASLGDGLVIDWISVFDRAPDALFCFNFEAVQKLRNYRLRTMNYVVGFDANGSIQDQMRSVMPASDFCVLSGTSLMCDGRTTQLSDYMGQKGKYGLLVNMRSANRKLLLKEWSAE